MHVDYYTKAVLTVIAAALTISAMQNMVRCRALTEPVSEL
jgi:hypothetical protein